MKRFFRAAQPAACLVSLFTLFFLVQQAAGQPAAPKKVLSIEGITEYRLNNGLRVLLYPDPSTTRVTVNMTVLVGSRHEGYGETGMAHLLEHMLFKGTPRNPNVPKMLRDHGANFNGTTWVDRTNYFEIMPASDANLEFAIALEADRLVNSFVKREDLASEMTVVRNEFEAGENNPLAILSQRMTAAAFDWHNYGKSTIGNRSDIERVPIDSLQAFYRKYYRPDNVILIIAGKFDEAKALDFVMEHFGPLKKPAHPIEKTYTEEPPQDGEREVILRRVGKVGAAGALYHIPAAAHEDFPPCEVLANLLDYEPNGRLYKALVTTKKATNVFSFATGSHDPNALEVIAQVGDRDEKAIRGVLDIMLEVLEKAHTEEFPKDEVERIKRKLLKERELLMTDVNRIGITLSEWAARGDWRLFFLHRDRLEKVTQADVTRVAKKYLQRSNRTTGLFLPQERTRKTPIPETPDLAELLKDYKGGKALAAGESFDPTPANIEKRLKRVDLPSGVKAALLPKKTRGDQATVSLSLRFGNDQSLKGQVSAAEIVGVLVRRGTKDMTRQQLDDELDKLKARVGITSGTGQLNVNIQCKRENLAAVLKLLGKMLREPSFPADEFEVYKRQTLKGLEESMTEPQALAVRAMRRSTTPTDKDDVRYIPTTEEEFARVKETTLDRVKQLYREQLSGQHGELVAVGDFNPEELTSLVGEMLNGWKSDTPYRRIKREAYPDRKGDKIVIATPDKENAVFIGVETFNMKDDDPDYPALQVGNYLLGGAPLASRLSNRVRGKEGLSYGVGSQVQAAPLDPFALFMFFAICNPKNIDKVDSTIAEELQKFFKEGVEEKELTEGIKAYLLERKNQRLTDAGLVTQLATNLYAGRTMAFQEAQEQAIAELTVDKVNTAFRKHIDPKRLILIRAGDFSKKNPKP
jgi:zinc protease